MKVLIVTVAGVASRFNKGIKESTPKCIYNLGNETIIKRLIRNTNDLVDRIIIVGGFMYNKLSNYIDDNFDKSVLDKIILINNKYYESYGSNYSLYLGLLEALRLPDLECITFIEGDLVVDRISLRKILLSEGSSIITSNKNIIESDKSVAFWVGGDNHINYVYDSSHNLLKIDSPFKSIHNSGQVWKFNNMDLIKTILENQTEDDYKDTNLNIITKYFSEFTIDSVKLISFRNWFNCNTLKDLKLAFNKIK